MRIWQYLCIGAAYPLIEEDPMAKSQKRSNREAKKPKAAKPKPAATSSAPSLLQGGAAGKKPAKSPK